MTMMIVTHALMLLWMSMVWMVVVVLAVVRQT
jgi:hypothetical protein